MWPTMYGKPPRRGVSGGGLDSLGPGGPPWGMGICMYPALFWAEPLPTHPHNLRGTNDPLLMHGDQSELPEIESAHPHKKPSLIGGSFTCPLLQRRTRYALEAGRVTIASLLLACSNRFL